MKSAKKEKKRRFEREAWVTVLLNLWPLIMFIAVLIAFLLRISLQ